MKIDKVISPLEGQSNMKHCDAVAAMQEKQEQIMARKVAMNRKKVKNIVQY